MENINVKGKIEFPKEIIGSFSITGPKTFYDAVCKEDYSKFAAKLKDSKEYYDNVHRYDDEDHCKWW